MADNQTEELRKGYFRHIETHKDDDLVKRIIKGETSLKKEAEEFYDIHIPTASGGESGATWPDNPKPGKVPDSLLDIIEPFNKRTFDRALLSYESVQDAIRCKNKQNNKFYRRCTAGIGLAFPGEIVAVHAWHPGIYTESFYAGIAVCIGGLAFTYKTINDIITLNNTHEDTEYEMLIDSTIKADDFMKDYRIYHALNLLKTEGDTNAAVGI